MDHQWVGTADSLQESLAGCSVSARPSTFQLKYILFIDTDSGLFLPALAMLRCLMNGLDVVMLFSELTPYLDGGMDSSQQ
jgi:hypothetical protein